MTSTIELRFLQVAAAYIFVLILLAMVRIRGIRREKEILIASVRMTLQLILIGYILTYIFEARNLLITLSIIILMEIFAIYNIFKRVKLKLPQQLKKIIAISMFCGTFTTLCYFILLVLRVYPPFEPRFLIPIAGMIIGNSMTGITLGVQNLLQEIHSNKDKIETALMLGATPQMAVKNMVDSAFDSALLPSINSMVGMGIIFLPGMMTGQILAGASPLTAISYQIVITLGIAGSVSLTVFLFLQIAYRVFFNKYCQLKLE